MGKCRFPLYISKTKAEEWSDIWHLLNEQRMARNEWSVAGPEGARGSLHSTIAVFRTIAERDHARARRRFLRARRLTPPGG